jgi:hypothetical protein
MKSFIKKLVFDRQLVTEIKKASPDPDYLYKLLQEGKITMQEYLLAAK